MEKIIFHIDVNSAYLSWTAWDMITNRGEETDIRTIPAVIGGDESSRHGVVLAKSLPAKKYGIHTGESLMEARRKCPVLLTYAPDFNLYVSCSRKLMALLKEYSPEIDQYSIDEAFVDMTGTRRLFGDPEDVARTIADRARDALGFTVNIGISNNRILAKMASDFEKPDKVHTLYPDEIPEKMWPLPVSDLFFVGRSTRQKLDKYGIRTIGDLAHCDISLLTGIFGKTGRLIHDHANGLDTDYFRNTEPASKGYGNGRTVGKDITDIATAQKLILSLCEEVCARLRRDGGKAYVLTLSLVGSDFKKWSHQCPLDKGTDDTMAVFRKACTLLDECWKLEPLRQITVSTSGVKYSDFDQMSLFETEKDVKEHKLNLAIDSIRKTYGEDAVKRGSLMKTQKKTLGSFIHKDDSGKTYSQ